MKAEALLAADSAAGRVSGSIQVRQQNENGPYQKALFEEMRPGDVQVRGPDRTATTSSSTCSRTTAAGSSRTRRARR
jgi:hypothetical protein